MLQSGGVQLLDVQTLMAVRNDESVIRWGLNRMAWYQKLSDELIVPNVDQDISFFYDPTTKKLRKRFEIYPDALDANVHATSSCHSERSEESQIISGPLLMELNQRCLKAWPHASHFVAALRSTCHGRLKMR